MSFRACVYADAPRFLTTLIVSLYMTLVVLPAFRSNPLSPSDFDQALGLPPGTTATTQQSPDTSTSPYARPTSAPARRTPGRTLPGGYPRANTPDALFRLARLLWAKFGGMLTASIFFGTLGWVWSTILLVLGIHRLQQISPAAAIGVVLLMYVLAALLILLVIFGFASLIIGLMSGALHSAGALGGTHH